MRISGEGEEFVDEGGLEIFINDENHAAAIVVEAVGAIEDSVPRPGPEKSGIDKRFQNLLHSLRTDGG